MILQDDTGFYPIRDDRATPRALVETADRPADVAFLSGP